MLFLRSFFCLCWFINCVNVFILNFLGRSRSSDAENPGNNLYVTGLSPRITKRELEKHFAAEGKVSILFIVFLFHYSKGWWVKSWFNAMWEWFLCAVLSLGDWCSPCGRSVDKRVSWFWVCYDGHSWGGWPLHQEFGSFCSWGSHHYCGEGNSLHNSSLLVLLMDSLNSWLLFAYHCIQISDDLLLVLGIWKLFASFDFEVFVAAG